MKKRYEVTVIFENGQIVHYQLEASNEEVEDICETVALSMQNGQDGYLCLPNKSKNGKDETNHTSFIKLAKTIEVTITEMFDEDA